MRRLAVALLLTGCGLDEIGEQVLDGSADVVAFDVVKDVQEEPVVCADAGPASCTTAVQFRSPVLFSPDAGTPCPPGYDTRDLALAVPTAPNCTCQCTNAGTPSCDTTVVNYKYGLGDCNLSSGSYTLNGCTATNQPTFTGENVEIDPPNVLGGCGGGTSVPPGVASTTARVCTPQCVSDESVCTGEPGLRVCVIVGGNVASCPAGYGPIPFYIGEVPSATCDSCSCAQTGDCTGSTDHLYTDMACGPGDQSFPMDGQCHALTNGQINGFRSAQIKPSLKAPSCSVSLGAAHTAYGGNDFSVCCK